MGLEDQVGRDSRGKPAGELLLTIAIAQNTEGSPTISDLNKVEQSLLQPTTKGKVPGLSTSDLAIEKVGSRWRGLSKGILLLLIGETSPPTANLLNSKVGSRKTWYF